MASYLLGVAADSAAPQIACSVVIPVYNRGEALAASIETLREQTIGTDRFEIIYVDDGSNDGYTPAMIDKIVAETPFARVFHEPPSGSPGRPRNVGLAHAQGEYVFFSDHDDWFDPHALENLVTFARQNSSDIVIGKVVAHGTRAVIPRLFRQSQARLATPEAMISLTPHKLFRRDLLQRNQISYPEGKRRLEDHHFVAHAYLHADVISVFADRVCYHHNEPDESNFSQTVSDPAVYTNSNLDVIELIRRHTEGKPELCNALLERPIRHELLKKASPRLMPQLDAAGESHKHRILRTALVESAPPEVVDRLGAYARATAKALHDDNPEAIRRLDERSSSLSLDAELLAIRGKGQAWTIDFAVTVLSDGRPLLFHSAPGEGAWRLDESALAGANADRTERERELLAVDLEVLIANRRSSVQWHLPATYQATLEGTERTALGRRRESPAVLTISGSATIDVTDIGGEQIEAGLWDVFVRTDLLGVELRARLFPKAEAVLADPPRASLNQPQAEAMAVLTNQRGSLAIDVGASRRRRARAS